MAAIYFPSCNFTKVSPRAAKRLRDYMKERMPVAGCCRVDKTPYPAGDTALYFCQACRETLEAKEGNQLLLENLVSKAVQENSRVILKELDFQFRQMEENAQAREEKRKEREEEHYRKLDELICQRGRRKGKRKKHPGTKF